MSYLLLAGGITAAAALIPIILRLVTAWKVFEKYGEPGWHGLIPIYSDFKEYQHCWSTSAFWVLFVSEIVYGLISDSEGMLWSLLAIATGIIAIVMEIIFCKKKSAAFGGRLGLALLIFFLPFIANLYLGFGKSRYIGKQG